MSLPDKQAYPLRRGQTGDPGNPHRDIMKKLGSTGSSAPSMESDRSKDTPPDLREEEESIKSWDSGSVSTSSVSSGRDQCDVCSRTAVKKCLTCMASYCWNHVKDHYTSPDLEKHQLQDLTHQNPQDTSSNSIIRKDIPSPGQIQFTSVQPDSVSLRWSPPEGAPGPHRFRVTWKGGQKQHSMVVAGLGLAVTELIPGEKYHFVVATLGEDGYQSSCVEGSVHTEVPPPENLTVDLSSSTAYLKWTKPAGVDQASYLLELFRDQKCIASIHRDSPNYTITDIQPGRDYMIRVYTILSNDRQSEPSSQIFKKDAVLTDVLQDLDLMLYYPEKLSLSTVLEIGSESVSDDPVQSLSSLPRLFLKKLMMANVTARSVKLAPSSDAKADEFDTEWDSDEDSHDEDRNCVNPLDILTALFLCSDSFLQQEMALKMSLCQFSVPLLLPDHGRKQITFMLWAMRDIVKKFRPHSLTDSKGFVEERIVDSNLPMVSFVRLGKSSLSKSHILNMLLSNPQQYHDTFVHRNMESGDALKMISNGLVEISWYLPCGNKSINVFPEPVAVANLRGDISTFETQYCFLCQTSAAVFVFFDDLETNYKMLPRELVKGQLFLVGNPQSSTFNYHALKSEAKRLGLTKRNVIVKDKQNDADFTKILRSKVTDVITNNPHKITMEQMATVAEELGIPVDEKTEECQRARTNANEITSQIQDIQQFKVEQLPLQGDIWLELARVEKEECRLRKAGNQDLETYKSTLKKKKEKLREDQRQHDMSEAMTCFISALSSGSVERSYFLKWMRMNLDNLSRTKLSTLRKLYQETCQDPEENKNEIMKLDKKISKTSLGIEHFLREMGQLYESVSILSRNEKSHEQILSLSRCCAKLLLDGFPIELVDGDASNIPIRWVSDVLDELNNLVKPNNTMLVVTVLGVQSTGKSTLLNTMFGVQFAVSSGRCTRGAFMLLIKLKDDMRKELNCDFLLIIDTEGLKSAELAQLDYSHEHDNELATLIVGLSDVTITNIAMENSAEMKDILQIVVHAFLRMKEVGKKPKCLFVHQNVADVSAHGKNIKDRRMLLEQLNEMTQAASRMEDKEDYRKFTDVMEYDPETDSFYIAGLWHGTPPMSPVSAGYSESVYDFKKTVLGVFKKCKAPRTTIADFASWTKSLWSAVKFENFIFSFRNSLVAEAYMKVCTEFSKWELNFRKDMHKWITAAETNISNFGKFSEKSETLDIKSILLKLKTEACTELTKGEKNILDNIASHYDKKECHVELIERYRVDFENSAVSVRKELDFSVTNRLDGAVSIRQGMIRLESIKNNHASVLEEKVLTLLEDCRKSRSDKSEEDLRSDFENMWGETIRELSFKGLERQNIRRSVFTQVWNNLKQKGSLVAEHLLTNTVNLQDYEMKPFTVEIKHFKKKWEVWKHNPVIEVQELSNKLIANCQHLVENCTSKETDYDDTYTIEILDEIDAALNTNKLLKKIKEVNEGFEVSLKLHVCANAARDFQKMHDCFIENSDLQRCLEKNKQKYWTDFKDIFHERDQSQKKADEFTSSCLKPAVEMYIAKVLGMDIVDTMLSSKGAISFSSRPSFQYSLLKKLLDDSKFEEYVSYICSYEEFVKNWISEQINANCPEDTVFKMEKKYLSEITMKITEAISKAQEDTKTSSNIKDFINNICTTLKDDLIIPNDALVNFLALNHAKHEAFVKRLLESVCEMRSELSDSLKKRPLKYKLESIGFKPQDVLFKQIFGCGQQCPFCEAPCEAGGKEHDKHFASVHRPTGLGTYKYVTTKKLFSDICSSLVVSDKKFNCKEASHHPWTKYTEIFPDWHIPPDGSVQASDYWRYVLKEFNEKFAERYNAKPADIPDAWKDITKERAEQVLKEYYNMK